MRLVDIMLSIPTFPLLIALASVLGKGVWQIIMVIVVFGWMGDARLVRSVVLSLKQEEFSEAARAIGVSPSRIMFVHYLPNVMAPIIVSTTLGIGSAIVYEAAISFLGLWCSSSSCKLGKYASKCSKLCFYSSSPCLVSGNCNIPYCFII